MMDAAGGVTAGNAEESEPLPLPVSDSGDAVPFSRTPSFTFEDVSDSDDGYGEQHSDNGEPTSDNGAAAGLATPSRDNSAMNVADDDDVVTAGSFASSEPFGFGFASSEPPSTTTTVTFSQMLNQVEATHFPEIQFQRQELQRDKDDGEQDSLNGEHASPDAGAGPDTPSDRASADDSSDSDSSAADDNNLGSPIRTSPSWRFPSLPSTPGNSPSPERQPDELPASHPRSECPQCVPIGHCPCCGEILRHKRQRPNY